MMVFLVILAYVLYFFYDINEIRWKNHFIKSFFAVGTLLTGVVTVFETIKYFSFATKDYILIPLCVLAVLLLFYCLFFAIPFKKTYVEESTEREAYTGGVYSLCRHPGFMSLALVYVLLALMAWSRETCIVFGLIVLGDLLYVIFQDVYVFPRTFTNYEEYKKTTGFVIWRKRRK